MSTLAFPSSCAHFLSFQPKRSNNPSLILSLLTRGNLSSCDSHFAKVDFPAAGLPVTMIMMG